jgi:hypothetical protein
LSVFDALRVKFVTTGGVELDGDRLSFSGQVAAVELYNVREPARVTETLIARNAEDLKPAPRDWVNLALGTLFGLIGGVALSRIFA